jgi:hypothetical protein
MEGRSRAGPARDDDGPIELSDRQTGLPDGLIEIGSGP